MVNTVIKNCKVVQPHGIFRQGLAIDNGKIIAIGYDDYLPPAKLVIDAKGNHVIPGLVDPHFHLMGSALGLDPAQEIRNETEACAYGGVSTIINMLRQTGDLPRIAKDFVTLYEENGFVDLALTVALWQLADVKHIRTLAHLGVAGFKLLTHYRLAAATAGLPGLDDGIIYSAFEEIGKLVSQGYKIFARAHCENSEIFLAFKSRMLEEKIMPHHWHETRPNFVEAEAMRRYIYLAHHAGCPFYIVHVSIKEGLDIITRARGERISVIAETCPQYLVLNSDNCDGILAKVQPPIRTKEDNEALWQGIREGAIDSVGTDHAAARRKHKGESIWNAGLGIAGIAHWLQIMLSEGVNKGRISLEKLVEVCCYNPAHIHGLTPKKGLIAVGSDADLVIVDLDKEVVAGPNPPYTGSDFNVYEGWKFKGCAVLTIVRGKVVMQDGKVVGTPGFGRYNPAHTR